MSRALAPAEVAARLAALRELHVAETVDEARARLARERPRAREPLEVVAARGLSELRALCELARHVRQRS